MPGGVRHSVCERDYFSFGGAVEGQAELAGPWGLSLGTRHSVTDVLHAQGGGTALVCQVLLRLAPQARLGAWVGLRECTRGYVYRPSSREEAQHLASVLEGIHDPERGRLLSGGRLPHVGS